MGDHGDARDIHAQEDLIGKFGSVHGDNLTQPSQRSEQNPNVPIGTSADVDLGEASRQWLDRQRPALGQPSQSGEALLRSHPLCRERPHHMSVGRQHVVTPCDVPGGASGESRRVSSLLSYRMFALSQDTAIESIQAGS